MTFIADKPEGCIDTVNSALRVNVVAGGGGGGGGIVTQSSGANLHANIDNFPATQPVSLATAPTTPVTGTFFQATQPVSGTVSAGVPALGQALAAASLPVVLTAAQITTLTPPAVFGGVVTQGTGTNLHVVVDTAPTTAVTGTFFQGTQPVSLATAPTTPVTGTFFQATQPVSNAGTFAVQAAATLAAETTKVIGTVNVSAGQTIAVTGTFFQATQPVSVAPNTAAANALTNAFVSASGALALIKATAGNLYGMYFLNTTAAVAWVQIFNSATTGAVTLGTTQAVFTVPLAASAVLYIPASTFALVNCSAGIVYAATTLFHGSVAAALSGTIQYL